jgi:lysophospholipase L1-like esterase
MGPYGERRGVPARETTVERPRHRRRLVLAGLAAAGAGLSAAGWTLLATPTIANRTAPASGNDAGTVARGRRLPSTGPLTYVAIGASDATGAGVADPRRDGWVAVFARELPPSLQPVRLINLGIPGSTLRRALAEQLPRAVEVQPHLVTVWLVVNDALAGVSLADYAADLDQLLDQLRTRTSAVVAIGNAPYPPASLDPWGLPEAVRRAAAMAWNTVIARAARKHGAVLVDIYTQWPLVEHPEYIGPDGLHPTAAGYRALAGVFHAALRAEGVL